MFKDKYGPWALVIGGSEGIGLSFAQQLAAHGVNLALMARKPAALEATAAAVRKASKVEVRTLSQDITAPDMMEKVKAFTKDMDVGLVIYNAGAMDRMPTFLDDTVEGHMHTIRLNCEGPVRIAHHFGGLMTKKKRGGIVLMSSVAALAGAYAVAVYGATKSFDMLLAEGLWFEWKDTGVSVLCAVIGATRTPSHERLLGEDRAEATSPDEIAEEVLANIDKGPTLFVKSILPMVPAVRDQDRRKAVMMLGEAGRAFMSPQANKKPYDPKSSAR